MAMTARDIGKIPSGDFAWYVYLLIDGLSDTVRDDLIRNFEQLGNLIGPDGLVVKGYDAGSFNKDIMEAYSGVYRYLDQVLPPALLVTDTAPRDLADTKDPMVMVFQLNELSQQHGSVAEFLARLMRALGDPETLKALKEQEPSKVRRCWQWLGQYVSFKPGAFGCSVNVHKAIEDIIKGGEKLVAP